MLDLFLRVCLHRLFLNANPPRIADRQDQRERKRNNRQPPGIAEEPNLLREILGGPEFPIAPEAGSFQWFGRWAGGKIAILANAD